MAGQASRNPSPGPHPVENSMHQKRNIISPCRKQETSERFRVAFQEWLFTCCVHAEWEPSLSRGRERGIQKAITRYYKLNAVLIVLCFLVIFIVKVQQFVLHFFSIEYNSVPSSEMVIEKWIIGYWVVFQTMLKILHEMKETNWGRSLTHKLH